MPAVVRRTSPATTIIGTSHIRISRWYFEAALEVLIRIARKLPPDR
jgi:hypothetical protein